MQGLRATWICLGKLVSDPARAVRAVIVHDQDGEFERKRK
jgi:hypothetical protein